MKGLRGCYARPNGETRDDLISLRKPNLQNPDTRLGRSNLHRRLRTRFRHEFLHELNQGVCVSFRDSIIEGCADAYHALGSMSAAQIAEGWNVYTPPTDLHIAIETVRQTSTSLRKYPYYRTSYR